MPDVGVLNLQIRDDSAKAAEGLNRLATSLDRVKRAVGSGLKLSGVANQIKRINDAMATAIPEESISRLERLAKAIDGLNATGGVKLSGLKSVISEKDVTASVSRVRESIESGIGGAFNEVKHRAVEFKDEVEKADQLIQNMAWTAGDMAKHFSDMFQAFAQLRAARAIGNGGRIGIGAGYEKTEETGWTSPNPYGETGETGWTEWKNGAIEVEYTISEATESITNKIDGVNQLLLESGNDAKEASGDYKEALSEIKEEADKVGNAFERVFAYKRMWDRESNQFVTVPVSQEEWNNKVAEVANLAATASAQEAQTVAEEFNKTGSVIDTVAEKVKRLGGMIKDIGKEEIANLKGGFLGLLSPVANLIKQFARLAKYRMLRAVIKEITSGVSEGVENYYRYSQAINSAFAPAMDSAATALQQMKNSIGAALAPAIQALIPYLQMAVNAFISLINYANQFFALLRGQATWSRATNQSAKAFDEVKKSAGGASAAVKDLLADWDELNIIQSESNKGGGGGGGVSAMQDYLGMFEEVSKFDNKIKDAVDFIEKHMGGIGELAATIGTAILGWKISEVFGGVLGFIGSLVAGGAIVKLGLEFAYGAGYDAGMNGSFGKEQILETIGGAVATFLGLKFIGLSSLAAFEIAVPVALMFALYGYIQGEREKEDLLKWGETSLTPEEIEEFVRSEFDFDIAANIDIVEGVIENQITAKRELNSRIGYFSESLDKVKIGIDGTPTGIREAAEAAGSVIEQVNKNLSENEKNLEVLTKITPILNEAGDDSTEDFLSGIQIANTTMSEYFTSLGQEIADWIDKGEKSGWQNNEAEMAMALMQHQERIVGAAEGNRAKRTFQVESELNLSSMTRDNAEAVLDRELELINEYTASLEEAYKKQILDYYYWADVADAIGAKDEYGNPLSEVYIAAAEQLEQDIKNGRVFEDVESSMIGMRQRWIDTFSRVYGEDFKKQAEGTNKMTDIFREFFGIGTYFETGLQGAYDRGGASAAAKYIEEDLSSVLGFIDPQGIFKKASESFGFNIFDVMFADAETGNYITNAIYEAVGHDSGIAMEILHAMGLSNEQIAAALKAEIPQVDEGVKSIKEQILDRMYDADWQNMSSALLNSFIEELADEFGDEAVWNALNELDIPESDLTIPVNATVEETIDDIEMNGGNNQDIEFDIGEVTVMGIPVEGGWFNNLFDRMWGAITGDALDEPIDVDMNVHVHYYEDDFDFSMEDIKEDWESKGTSGKMWTTGQLIARSGASSGIRYVSAAQDEPAEIVVRQDNSEQQGNVTSGVKNGTAELYSLLSNILNVANAISRKDFTVNVTPSTALGRTANRSQQYVSMVTGEPQ